MIVSAVPPGAPRSPWGRRAALGGAAQPLRAPRSPRGRRGALGGAAIPRCPRGRRAALGGAAQPGRAAHPVPRAMRCDAMVPASPSKAGGRHRHGCVVVVVTCHRSRGALCRLTANGITGSRLLICTRSSTRGRSQSGRQQARRRQVLPDRCPFMVSVGLVLCAFLPGIGPAVSLEQQPPLPSRGWAARHPCLTRDICQSQACFLPHASAAPFVGVFFRAYAQLHARFLAQHVVMWGVMAIRWMFIGIFAICFPRHFPESRRSPECAMCSEVVPLLWYPCCGTLVVVPLLWYPCRFSGCFLRKEEWTGWEGWQGCLLTGRSALRGFYCSVGENPPQLAGNNRAAPRDGKTGGGGTTRTRTRAPLPLPTAEPPDRPPKTRPNRQKPGGRSGWTGGEA
eukprot:gene6961-biopygen7468